MPENIDLGDGAKLTWLGGELEDHARKQIARKIRVACEYLKTQVQRNISTSSRRHGPSAEGDFPHANTGKLRQSIFASVDEEKLEGVVGTPLLYGIFLEYGTPGGVVIRPVRAKVLSWIDAETGQRRFARSVTTKPMKARSFLRRTLVEEESQIMAILLAKWPDMPGSFSVGA